MRTRLYPHQTRVCPPGRPAGARDACSRSRCALPCPRVPSERSGKGCVRPPRSFNIPEPLRRCPPPWRRLGGGGGLWALPGGARTRALLGALVVLRALVREIGSGGVCARLASPPLWDAATGPALADCVDCSHARSACAATRACAASMRCPLCARWQLCLAPRCTPAAPGGARCHAHKATRGGGATWPTPPPLAPCRLRCTRRRGMR